MRKAIIVELTTEEEKIGRKVLEIKAKYFNAINNISEKPYKGYTEWDDSIGELKFYRIQDLLEECKREVKSYRTKLRKKKLIQKQNETK